MSNTRNRHTHDLDEFKLFFSHKKHKHKNHKSSSSQNDLVRELFKFVIDGKREEAEKFLEKLQRKHPDISYVTIKTFGTEYNQRAWKNISALEFTAWAGDKALREMLLNYVPDAQKKEALDQLENVKYQGTEAGKLLNPYQALIAAYWRFAEKVEAWGKRGARPSSDDFLKIGKMQAVLPMIGLQWFFDPEPFDPFPSFEREPRRELIFYSGDSFIAITDKLGETAVLYKGLDGGAGLTVGGGAVSGLYATAMISALNKFCETEKKALDNDIARLKAEMPVFDYRQRCFYKKG